MDLRFKHSDVCTALREYMALRGMTPPDDDGAFKLKSEEDGKYAVEVVDVTLAPTTSRVVDEPAAIVSAPPASVDRDKAFQSALDSVVEDDESEETEDSPEEGEASDFSPEADEAALNALIRTAGAKPKAGRAPAQGQRRRRQFTESARPGRERFTGMQRYGSLAEAGKEDGDIADEID